MTERASSTKKSIMETCFDCVTLGLRESSLAFFLGCTDESRFTIDPGDALGIYLGCASFLGALEKRVISRNSGGERITRRWRESHGSSVGEDAEGVEEDLNY
ncbi:hypothetical protein GUJ93_ZPchr0010g7302 [Zizania palustris]|uniref:Uncharacterized protein n=1 Tax=Zizania palustris TaxID=103762 RepID=A0A8J5WHC2_ZIZPA|nr:hypothetical protein GUJ93_ZPchr0010g7302 [Zizania palustris]